jgi:hypothetical protein
MPNKSQAKSTAKQQHTSDYKVDSSLVGIGASINMLDELIQKGRDSHQNSIRKTNTTTAAA